MVQVGYSQCSGVVVELLSWSPALLTAALALPSRSILDSLCYSLPVGRIQFPINRHLLLPLFEETRIIMNIPDDLIAIPFTE